MTLFRRGRANLIETERQLDTITTETAELQRMLDAIRTQEALIHAVESQYTNVVILLAQLRDELADIDRTNDLMRKAIFHSFAFAVVFAKRIDRVCI